MRKLPYDELRKATWDALSKFEGDREKAAEALNVSVRTLNRYIRDCNLYPDMDKAGYIRNAGPPRGSLYGSSLRELVILRHIKRNNGEIDYNELSEEMYNVPASPKTLQRTYVAISELKNKGVIATDGVRWFVMKKSS